MLKLPWIEFRNHFPLSLRFCFAGLALLLLGCGGAPAPAALVVADSVASAVVEDGAGAEGGYVDETDGSGIVADEAYKIYIPEGYEIMDTAMGDLNLDAYPDLVLVLKEPQEVEIEDMDKSPYRPLLLLLGSASGNYTLAGRNDQVVYCYLCGGMMGDPYQRVVIKKGYFSVEHYGGSAWRWTHIITFKYAPDKKTWFLHKAGGDTFHASEPEKVETNVSTPADFGVVAFESYKDVNR